MDLRQRYPNLIECVRIIAREVGRAVREQREAEARTERRRARQRDRTRAERAGGGP